MTQHLNSSPSERKAGSVTLADTFETFSASIPEGQRLEFLVEMLRELPVVQEAFNRLRLELPNGLDYHNLEHTQEVFLNAIRLAFRAGCSLRELMLIAIQAAWHDTGFIAQRTHNEPIGAKFAARAMKEHGYGTDDIRLVVKGIIDTGLVGSPDGKALIQKQGDSLSRFVLDADLANLGSPLFFEKSLRVFNEMHGAAAEYFEGLTLSVQGRAFLRRTFHMFLKHDWQSEPARALWQVQKVANLTKLTEIMQRLEQ
jgi:predicted metal-dependent HD superfamily phosphohydrolase